MIFCFATTAFASGEINISSNSKTEVPIVLYESDNRTIVTYVPKDKAAEYEHKLTNDAFREAEIQKATQNIDNVHSFAARSAPLPEGRLIGQKFLYKSDIKRVVDRKNGSGTFSKWFDNPFFAGAAAKLLTLLKAPSFISATAGILAWAGANLEGRIESWWKDSYIMILEGSIRAVRVTHIENTVSEYPKAYMIIDRI